VLQISSTAFFEEECSNIGEEDLDFLASVFKVMGPEQKNNFFKAIAS